MEYSEFIKNNLQEASKIAERSFGKVKGEVKKEDNNQVLTETDIEIGNFLVSKIKESYPEYNIIDEEAGVIDNGSEYTWVVDPIDGTSNFVVGLPMYGVMIGLLNGGTPIAGGIALPSFIEVYVAEKGRGAYCNGEKISVSREEKLANVLVSYGIDGHPENPEITKHESKILEKLILNIRNLRTSNSAYDFAMTASGKYGGGLNRTSKIWDNVAPHIITEEAGGVYTNFSGGPMDYSDPISKAEDNFEYIAAAPHLHDEILNIINNIEF